METCPDNNEHGHSYRRFGFTKDGVLYYCNHCRNVITRSFDEHVWAMRNPEPFDTEFVIELIDKSNIDEVNDCREIYEACTPQEIEEYMKSKYPVETNLVFFREQKSESCELHKVFTRLFYYVYKNPHYVNPTSVDVPNTHTVDIDKLQDYAIKYGPIYLDGLHGSNIRLHSIEEIEKRTIIIDGIFTYNKFSGLFSYDENAKEKIIKRKERKLQKKKESMNIFSSLNLLLEHLTNKWMKTIHPKMKIRWAIKSNCSYIFSGVMKDTDLIEGIYQFDKLLKNPIIQEEYLDTFIEKLEVMKTFKGKAGQEKFVEMLPKFSQWIKKKQKLLKKSKKKKASLII